MLYLEVELLFPHLLVFLEDLHVMAPHALKARGHGGDLQVHEEVHELQARQQVLETQPAQHEVHSLRQERVEAHVHVLLALEALLHLGPPHQLQDGDRHHAGVELLQLAAQVHAVQDGHGLEVVALALVGRFLEVEHAL